MSVHRLDHQQNMRNYINSDADISDCDPWEDADFDEPLEWLKSHYHEHLL